MPLLIAERQTNINFEFSGIIICDPRSQKHTDPLYRKVVVKNLVCIISRYHLKTTSHLKPETLKQIKTNLTSDMDLDGLPTHFENLAIDENAEDFDENIGNFLSSSLQQIIKITHFIVNIYIRKHSTTAAV